VNRSFLLAAGLAAAIWPTMVPGADTPRDRDVLARAGAFVRRLQAELPRLVARETMDQRATPAGGGTVEVPERRLVSELGWAPLVGTPDLLAVRDVVEVDGQPLTAERLRLQELLHSGRGTLAEATRLLNEGARYNLSPGSRNFNLPTVALFFLHPQSRDRFSWSRTSARTAPVWRFEFKERRSPTVIRDGNGRPVHSRGSVDVEAATGTILRTELRLRYRHVDYTLVTTFSRVESLGLVLPSRMDERYAAPTGVIAGTAVYDDYRRFQTGAKLVG
jgi:hypothetical protein